MPGLSRDNDTETFEPPLSRLEVIPGQIFIRLHPEAISDAAPTGSGEAAALAEAITEPLTYLRENFGLRSLRALSDFEGPAARELWSPQLHSMAVAVATTAVAEPEPVLAGVLVAELDPSTTTESVLRDIEASPAIEFAEPAATRWLCADPDPARNRQWGLRAVRWFESRARHPDTSDIRVDIIDSGIDTTHRLIPRLALEDYGPFMAEDLIGHGTHVAGIVAAATDDDAGVAGVTSCAIGSRKVFPDAPQGNTFNVDTAALQAAMEAAIRGDTKVINLSLAGTRYLRIEELLVREAVERGVTVVAAMGNERKRRDPVCYPAAYDGVISVGSIAENGRGSGFSSTGDHIDLVAPGSNVLSTVPMQPFGPWRIDTDLVAWSGTSMAAPYVTGAVALLVARDPALSPADVRDRLRDTARGLPEMAGSTWTAEHGCGLLDLDAALS